MEDIRNVMGAMSGELGPLTEALKKGNEYTDLVGPLETATQKTNNLAGFFDGKAKTFREYMGQN